VGLDKHRSKADFILVPAAERLKDVNPNMISWAGLVLAFISGLVLYLSYDVDYLLIAGAALVLLSGFFDALDGKVAKLSGKASAKGDFLDHVFDRYADVFMIGGVAVSGWCNPYLGILALVGVLLTSYMGTQAQAVGAKRLYAGLLGRADRVLLLTLFPLIQYLMIVLGYGVVTLDTVALTWMEIVMLWFAIVGNLTAIQRVLVVWNPLSEKD